MRHRVNPARPGRPPRERDGRNDHKAPSWEERLQTSLDTERALSSLPNEQRIVLLLVYGLELSVSEAAWLIGVSARTLSRAIIAAESNFDDQTSE